MVRLPRKMTYTPIFLAYRDDILAHETAAWQELVDEVFILELTVKIRPVRHAIPWLYTDERGVLATRCPYAHGWGLEVERDVWFPRHV